MRRGCLAFLLSCALVLSVTPVAAAQEISPSGPLAGASGPRRPRASPTWTWAMLGTGIGLLTVGLGTGVGALVVQLDLDRVCMLTCPTRVGDYQREGRILAITTDVLWLSGLVTGVFGLVAALTLEEDVIADVPAIALACDEHGCAASVAGRF